MRIIPCLLLLIVAGLGPDVLRAQDKLTRPEILPRDAAELEIALGRIRLVPHRFRIVRKHDQFDWPAAKLSSAELDRALAAPKACSRSLHVTAQDGRPALKLTYADPTEKWTVTVDNIVGAQWTRELLSTQPAVSIRYEQPPYQPIKVTIEGVRAQPFTLSAVSLWHMTEQCQPEFEQYVLPALLRLNSTWDLPRALAAAKRMRSHSDLSVATTAKHELALWISQLDSTDRATRESAKQKLRDTGLAAHIPLQQLRGGPLSPQQRSTVDELLTELEPRTADTPSRLAYWLAGDSNWR